MLKLKIKLFALFLCGTLGLQAQTNQYKYKRELKGISTTWNGLQLPNQLFSKVQVGLADLRIYGYKGKDTVEVPYILEQSANQITESETPFNIINKSSNANAFYYTFQASAVSTINQIKLSFKQLNFDWRVVLEGSNDNQNWFTLLKDYRILAIKNNQTDYKFSELNFPTASYKYFRMAIKASEQPELTAAKVLKTDTLKGVYKTVAYRNYNILNDKANKTTSATIDLAEPTPLSYLKINLSRDIDFYRNLTIEYATDSFKTEKGMQYNYEPLFAGTISSLELPEFNFPGTLLSRLKLTIENNDNKPLYISSFELKGPVYELVGRFDDQNLNYFLYYGSKDATTPVYELKNFENKIPMTVNTLTIGDEQLNPNFKSDPKKTPLFENKLWLYGLMVLIIALLGFFAFKMLKN